MHADLSPADLLAVDGYKECDPEAAIVVSAVKGGLGKLRGRLCGEG